MRFSKLLAPTLRENPAEAEVVSHQLLVRAGFIRRLSNGVYSYLPLMWRVLKKVENIVRSEMDRAGAQELLMPILQPAELWQSSGRWDVYGPLMMRVQDRHERWYGLAPTAEEVITDIATKEVQSYRQLPVNLYQIQTKYRDEIRPRFGLLRGREFIMKDAYSFHATQADLDREYDVMAETYTRIFDRCGLETRMVRSDSGAIGGSVSHEFMVLTRIAEGEQESGENEIFYCNQCDYAANVERADSITPSVELNGESYFSKYKDQEIIETPGTDTIDKLVDFFNKELKLGKRIFPKSLICKALLYIKDGNQPFYVLIRGDLEVEETKLLNTVGANEIRMATPEEIKQYTNSVKGFVGIGDLYYKRFDHYRKIPSITIQFGTKEEIIDEAGKGGIPAVLDSSVLGLKNFVIAFNKPGFHKVNFNWKLEEDWQKDLFEKNSKDLLEKEYFNIKRANIRDICPECEVGTLEMTRGIEVGNIFQLGTKYSAKMSATYTDEDGSEKPFIMGCYGIGVTRTAAAAIERFHDKNGIVWPMSIAPYQVVVVPVNVQDETQMNLAMRVYDELLAAGVEVVLDDRDERAGVKFKDADLIGYPVRVTAGKKAGEGLLEVKMRDADQPQDMPAERVLSFVQQQIKEWKPQLAPAKALQPQA